MVPRNLYEQKYSSMLFQIVFLIAEVKGVSLHEVCIGCTLNIYTALDAWNRDFLPFLFLFKYIIIIIGAYFRLRTVHKTFTTIHM